uniref:Uncharacterized protein n=1 Tax=Solanum tuberosum TaxID=4113 RepID=M1DB44_SOLTU
MDTTWQKRTKTAEKTKKRRPEDRPNHWAIRRIALTAPIVPYFWLARESEWAKAEVVLKSGNSVFKRTRVDSRASSGGY